MSGNWKNAIEYAVNIETGPEITADSLPEKVLNYRQKDSGTTVYSLDHLQKDSIVKALREYGLTTEGKEGRSRPGHQRGYTLPQN